MIQTEYDAAMIGTVQASAGSIRMNLSQTLTLGNRVRLPRTNFSTFLLIAAFLSCMAFFVAPDGVADEYTRVMTQLRDMRAEGEEVLTKERQEFLKKEVPATIEWLEQVREAAKSVGATLEMQFRAAETPIHLGHLAQQLQEIKRFAPAEYEWHRKLHNTDAQTEIVALTFRRAEGDDDRRELAKELRELLEKGFDLHQRMREQEVLEALGAQRARLIQRSEERKKDRNTIIERRFAQLTEGFDPFEW